MLGKNNKQKKTEKVVTYAIRKFSGYGAASVLVGLAFVGGVSQTAFARDVVATEQPAILSDSVSSELRNATSSDVWKPDNLEDGTDSVNISESGYSAISSINWKSWIADPLYAEHSAQEFGWSSKPGGNDNYADEIIRVKGKMNADKTSIHWTVTIKGTNTGVYKGVMRDFSRPYFLFATSRGLGKPENLVVKAADGTNRNYPTTFDDLGTNSRKVYTPEDVSVTLTDGKKENFSIFGKDAYPVREWAGGYRLGVTGPNREVSMNYNIEKYMFYSKYMVEDWIQGKFITGDETRIYEFDTKINRDEVAALGAGAPNVDSQFTDWMGWGKQRNDVDISNKVWIIAGATSREGAGPRDIKPNGQGIYNFSKVAVVDVEPDKDKYQPVYPKMEGPAGSEVTSKPKFKNKEGNEVEIPENTTFAEANENELSSGKTFLPNGSITVDRDTGEVEVTIDKATAPSEYAIPIKVTYPDGSSEVVTADIKVTTAISDKDKYQPEFSEVVGKPGSTVDVTPVIKNNDKVIEIPAGTIFKKVDDTNLATGEKQLPDGTTINVEETTGKVTVTLPQGTTPDNYKIPIEVTYPDGTKEIVKVPVKVLATDADKYTPVADKEVVEQGGTVNLTDNIQPIKDGENNIVAVKVEDITPNNTINTNQPGDYEGKVKVTYPDGSIEEVTVPVTITPKTRTVDNIDNQIVNENQLITPISVTVNNRQNNDKVEVTGLPNGVTYNPTTNQITGTPTVENWGETEKTKAYPVTVTVKDKDSKELVTKTFTITVQREADTDKYNPSYEDVQAYPGQNVSSNVTFKDKNDKDIAAPEETKYKEGPLSILTGIQEVPAGTKVMYDTTGKATIQVPSDAGLGVYGVPVEVTYKDGTKDNFFYKLTVVAKNSDTYQPDYPEAIGEQGETVKSKPTFKDEKGQVVTIPVNTQFKEASNNHLSGSDQSLPIGSTLKGIDQVTGEVTVELAKDAPAGEYKVPVEVTYVDGTKEIVKVPVKVKLADNKPEELTVQTETAQVIEKKQVDTNQTVVKPSKPNSTIIATGTNNLSVDNNGMLTGTPTIADWKEDEEEREVNIPVKVTNGTEEKDVVVKVTIQRDTDGDGIPDSKDDDDDNDGYPDDKEKDAGTNPKDSNSKPTVTYPEAVGKPGETVTSTPVVKGKDDKVVMVPTGATFEHVTNGSNLPNNTKVTVNKVTGKVTVELPIGAQPSDAYTVAVKVTYPGTNTTETITVPVKVNAVDKTATVVPIADVAVTEKAPITPITVTVNDKKADDTVDVTGLPTGVTYNPTTNQIVGTPTVENWEATEKEKAYPVTVTLKDKDSNSVATTTFTMTVQREADTDKYNPTYQDVSTKAGTKVASTLTFKDKDGKEATIPANTVFKSGPVSKLGKVKEAPAGTTVQYDAITGQATITVPSNADAGAYGWVTEVTYPDGTKDYPVIKLTVEKPEPLTTEYEPTYPKVEGPAGSTVKSIPEFKNKEDKKVDMPEKTTFAEADDTDLPNGKKSLSNGTISVDPNTGEVEVAIEKATAPGNYAVPVKVTYSDGSSEIVVVDVTVTPVIPNKDTYQPVYSEVSGKPDTTIHSTPEWKDKDGVPVEAPANTKFSEAYSSDLAEGEKPLPNGSHTDVDTNTGKVTVTLPKEAKPGDYKVPVQVTYPDNTKEIVKVSVNVLPTGADTYNPVVIPEIVEQGGKVDLTDNIEPIKDDKGKIIDVKVKDITPAGTIDTNKPGSYKGKVEVIYPDGSSEEVDVPVTVEPKTEIPRTISKINDQIAVEHKPLSPIAVIVNGKQSDDTVTVSGLPTGVTYDKATGQIVGTPTVGTWGKDEETKDFLAIVTVKDKDDFTVATTTFTLTVQRDTDKDGIPDVTDPDDDNDGFTDVDETKVKTDPKDPTSKPTGFGVVIVPVTTIENQPVEPNQTVVKPSKPQSTITAVETNGLSVDKDGNLTGTPKVTNWNQEEEERVINLPITVTNGSEKKNVTVQVTVLRDTDGDGIPDTRDTDDDNDGFSDVKEKEAGTNPKDPNSKPTTRKAVDQYQAVYPEAVGKAGTTLTSTPELTDKGGQTVPVPTGTTFQAISESNLPTGATVTVNGKTGQVTITLPKDATPGDYTVPVKVTYSDGSSEVVNVPVKVKPTDADNMTPVIPEKTPVANINQLTPIEKETVKTAIERVNNFPEGTTITIGNDGAATITYPDGSVDTISGKALVTKAATMADTYNPVAIPEVVAQGGTVDLTDNIQPIKDSEGNTVPVTIQDITPEGTIDTTKVGTFIGQVRVTYPDGTSEVVDVPVTVQAVASHTTNVKRKPSAPKPSQAVGKSATLPYTGEAADSLGVISGSLVAMLGMLGLLHKKHKQSE